MNGDVIDICDLYNMINFNNLSPALLSGQSRLWACSTNNWFQKNISWINNLSFIWRNSSQRAMASTWTRFLDHTQRRTTFGRTPLDEWSACRRDLYLTTHKTHNRPRRDSNPQSHHTSGRQTYVLDRAASGIGWMKNLESIFIDFFMHRLKNRSVSQPTWV